MGARDALKAKQKNRRWVPRPTWKDAYAHLTEQAAEELRRRFLETWPEIQVMFHRDLQAIRAADPVDVARAWDDLTRPPWLKSVSED